MVPRPPEELKVYPWALTVIGSPGLAEDMMLIDLDAPLGFMLIPVFQPSPVTSAVACRSRLSSTEKPSFVDQS